MHLAIRTSRISVKSSDAVHLQNSVNLATANYLPATAIIVSTFADDALTDKLKMRFVYTSGACLPNPQNPGRFNKFMCSADQAYIITYSDNLCTVDASNPNLMPLQNQRTSAECFTDAATAEQAMAMATTTAVDNELFYIEYDE